MNNRFAILVVVAFSTLGVVGDYLLKFASERKNPFGSKFGQITVATS
jgi:hypothetical protein